MTAGAVALQRGRPVVDADSVQFEFVGYSEPSDGVGSRSDDAAV